MNLSQLRLPSIAWASLLILAGGLAIGAQTSQAPSATANESVLQRRYDAAQRYQAAHDIDHAAQQYRIFIADALGEMALGRARAGQYDKAANNFDIALRLVPDFPTMQIEYARVALDSGDIDHARLLATSVIQSYPNNPKVQADAHAILGRILLKLNDDAGAKQQFDAAVAMDPTFENGYELAVADLDLGDAKGSATIFSEMLTSFGDTAAIHMYFGQAYSHSDFQDDAVSEFKKAIARDDRLPGVHYSLAAAYLSTAGSSKLPEAEEELRKEIAISPNYAAAYAALGHLLAQQHRDPAAQLEAESNLNRATELDPQSPDGFLYLGQFYADAHKLPEAEAALRQSIALTTDVTRNGFQVQKAHYLLGRLLIQTGDLAGGKSEIAISQSLMQQNLKRDQTQLADYLQTPRTAQAVSPIGPQMPMPVEDRTVDPHALQATDELEKQLGPPIADSYNNLGAIAGSKGDYHAALQYFDQAAEWNPNLPDLDFNWGRAAYAAGEFERAIPPLTHYLQTHADDQGMRAELGLSQFYTKNYAAASKTLEPLDGTSGEASPLQYAYAESLIKTGGVQSGIARLLTIEKADPKVAAVHHALGEAYVTEKSPAAAGELETAIRLDPTDVEAHIALAHLRLEQGNRRAAMTLLQAAVKLEPDNRALRKELADVSRVAAHH
jgi:tetratricopeptide (TPR) repeat protein